MARPPSVQSPLLPDAAPRQRLFGQRGSRVMDRASVFRQSRGLWNIRRRGGNWQQLYYQDVFHTLVNAPTKRLVALITLAYVFSFLFFAVWYRAIGDSCDMDMSTFMRALYFSVETQVTIGYGSPGSNIWFNDCVLPLVLIIAQSLVGVFLDALCIGLMFARFARGQTRASTVVFSDKAVLRRIRGSWYFMLQAAELRKHQLVEAHVRLYAIRRERDAGGGGGVYVQSYAMRLSHPDDELGSLMLMALPSVVVHRIDAWSPLQPPQAPGACRHEPSRSFRYPDILQRMDDSESGNRDAHICDVCGETFFSAAQLQLHQRFSALDDGVSGHGQAFACGDCGESFSRAENLRAHREHEGHAGGDAREDEGEPGDARRSHLHKARAGGLEEGAGNPSAPASEADLQAFFADRRVEIVALIEGIDSVTSATIQARHSFKWDEDFAWHQTFANCVSEDIEGGLVVDFARFHDLEPVPTDANEVSRVASVA